MKFVAKEDIEAPIEEVFAMLSDFEGFERAALRRGVEVQRTDTLRKTGAGMRWDARFKFRSRERNLKIEVLAFEPPDMMTFFGKVQGLEGTTVLELVALSRKRTRLSATLTLSPKTLSARLLVQSLKLAKSNLTKRFNLRVAGFAKELEDRYQQTA